MRRSPKKKKKKGGCFLLSSSGSFRVRYCQPFAGFFLRKSPSWSLQALGFGCKKRGAEYFEIVLRFGAHL